MRTLLLYSQSVKNMGDLDFQLASEVESVLRNWDLNLWGLILTLESWSQN